MKSLRQYLADYDAGHVEPGTRLTHMIGIPMIVASLPILPFNPFLGGGLFVGGWALQLVGHAVFERRAPAFLEDPLYLGVGVVWTAIQWASLLGVPLPAGDADEAA
jgi:uncharacterized membrane protein YGL010W